jgi:hypothetical protein
VPNFVDIQKLTLEVAVFIIYQQGKENLQIILQLVLDWKVKQKDFNGRGVEHAVEG